MPNVDALAYGMHLVFDGVHADPSRLADYALVERVVRDVGRLLGAADDAVPVVVEDEGGVSAGLALSEAGVAMHAFPGFGTLCLSVFSVQRRHAETLYRPVEDAFAVGRSTSRRSNRARAPRSEASEALARRLLGERAYAEARFVDLAPRQH
jgi:S-adenosylmethionine decarboxylase